MKLTTERLIALAKGMKAYSESSLASRPTFIYWVYDLGNPGDPSVDGYIGMTANLEKRCSYKGHPSQEEGRGVEVLHELPNRAEAYNLEFEYRPHSNIGLNKSAGGLKGWHWI
jgi:hypothetical protein